MKRYLPGGLLLLLSAALYLPTLRTGFLTDDFLDAGTTFSDASRAFADIQASGYRPLMAYSWALDNWLWGTGRQWGWHLTNLILFASAAVSLWFFLRLFVKDRNALLAGIALFAFSCPTAAAVAKTDWRTSLFPLIPLLWSMLLLVRYARRERGTAALVGSSFLLFVSLLLKETALAVPPAYAVLAWSQAGEGKRRTAALTALIAAAVPVAAYLFLRYFTVGLFLGYAQSASYGFFMLKNILVFAGKCLTPWFSGIPARILLPLFAVGLWLLPADRRLKAFLAAYTFFALLTVSNLPPRIDYALASLPALSLAAALFLQRYSSRKAYALALLCLSGVYLNSLDEVRMIQGASNSLDEQTERIARVAESVPGSGPVFIVGVREVCGSYGTFWPGEYMAPLRNAGFEPGRFVSGTGRIWQNMIEAGESCRLVFLDGSGGYRDYEVSPDMYGVLPDSTILAAGPILAGELLEYPSCLAPDAGSAIRLLSPAMPDSIVKVYPVLYRDEWYFDLASVPVWLAGDSMTVIVADFDRLVFSGCNIAGETALESLAQKQSALSRR